MAEEGPSGGESPCSRTPGRRELFPHGGAATCPEEEPERDLVFCGSGARESGGPTLIMKGCKGIENPAFVASSPYSPRRLCPSSSSVEVSVSSTNPLREGSPPQEPQEPQKSPEPPLSSVTPPGSQERSGPESLSEYEEGPCGWGNFQPQCLQCCNTPQGFLFHYCLLALTQGKVQSRLERAVGQRGAGGEERAGAPRARGVDAPS